MTLVPKESNRLSISSMPHAFHRGTHLEIAPQCHCRPLIGTPRIRPCMFWKTSGKDFLPVDQFLNAVGMIRLPTASASRLAAVWATTTLNFCSIRFKPPKKKHIPKTRSKFDNMLPMRDVWTMRTSSLMRARMATISSTALPKDAFNRPPIVSPVLSFPVSNKPQRSPAQQNPPNSNFLGCETEHGGKRSKEAVSAILISDFLGGFSYMMAMKFTTKTARASTPTAPRATNHHALAKTSSTTPRDAGPYFRREQRPTGC
jgi:hypothetical protein